MCDLAPSEALPAVGNGELTLGEQRAHFALWALLKSPLLIGADLRTWVTPARHWVFVWLAGQAHGLAMHPVAPSTCSVAPVQHPPRQPCHPEGS